MATTRMKREPDLNVSDPTLTDIQNVMEQILVDDDEQSLRLEFCEGNRPSQLSIIRVNDAQTGEATGWLVEFNSADKMSLVVLTASDRPGATVVREFFGAVVDIAEWCFPTEASINTAVVWFLGTGEPNPSQTWVDHFEAIRSH